MNSSADVSSGTSNSPKGASPGLIAGITVALMVSVTLNVLLARKVQRFNAAESAKIADRLLIAGTSVPEIAANRLAGQQETISYEGAKEPTVLYIFTPPCSWCARNIDNFRTLAEKETGQYRVLGISLSQEGLADYVAKNQLKLPVYSGLSVETLRTYKLGSTPQTIVISTDGKVLQDWVGAYVGQQKKEIEEYFHLSLPGLRELPKAEGTKN